MPGGRSRRSAARWAVSGEARQALSRVRKVSLKQSGAEVVLCPVVACGGRVVGQLGGPGVHCSSWSSCTFRARSGLNLGVGLAALLSGKGVGKIRPDRREPRASVPVLVYSRESG